MFDFNEFIETESRPHVEQYPWMKDKVMKLINTEEGLRQVVDDCIKAGKYACDLETEGLDNRVFDDRTVHQIVGACLSPDGHHGYYIPVRHREHPKHNIPVTVFEREMKRLFESPAIAIFHNATFDHEFLQFCGGSFGDWDDAKKYEDTMVLAYLAFSRLKKKSLKHLSKTLLSMEMIELPQLFDPKKIKETGLDFGLLDPTWEPVIWYGASDAICTFLLYERYIDLVTKGKGDFNWPGQHTPLGNMKKAHGMPKPHGGNQKTIYYVEKLTMPATRWMQRNRIPIDKPKVAELIGVSHREWIVCMEDVYTQVSEKLGRDVRPGKFRLMFGPSADKDWKFDLENPMPPVKDRLEEVDIISHQRGMDPMVRDDKGKMRVKTTPKEVRTLDGKGKERVAFPLVYDINAAQQLGLLFRELEVPGLIATEKSGQVKTSADELDRVVEETGDKFSFMGSMKRFRNVHKALSNLYPLYMDIDPRDHTLRVDFNQFGTDTGRYTTKGRGKTKDKQGGTSWNLHSTPATYDPKRPEGMRRIREVIKARPGFKIVAIDFAGVELRVVTNYSKEPEWMEEFFRCSACGNPFQKGDGKTTPAAPPPRCPNCGSDKIGDLHSLTAVGVYGEEAKGRADWKQLRNYAKGANFALCYGGGGDAVMRSTGCTKQEGWRIKNQFDKKYKGLARWWGVTRAFAKKHGYVMTAMGRWYPVPDIVHDNGFFRSKAERNAVNGPVQAGSADITKLAMAMIYRECKKRGWLDKVRMIITIHDELVFEIADDLLAESIEIICRIMTEDAVHRLKWPIPLTVDCEIGYDWTVPWDLNEMKYREIRFDGDKKVKPPKEDKFTTETDYKAALAAWEAMPHSFPESLRHLFTAEQMAPPSEVTGEGKSFLAPPSSAETFQKPEVREAIIQAARENGVSVQGIAKDTSLGEPYTHRIAQQNLSVGLANTLAEVIDECRGGGNNPLRIVVRETGEPLWTGDVVVHAPDFVVKANERGV
jgi:DNA polymerase I-like protein with 3'-5' exonuclease and polymerase domains